MSFFVTSVGPGKGGNLGGLLGADRHCQMLATLTENGSAGHPSVNARDRIGNDPCYNARGMQVASVAELHGDKSNINKTTALTVKGETLPGRGDTPNEHDNTAWGNWVRYFPMSGKARVGHFDRNGNDSPTNSSWNSAHDTASCSQDEINVN